MFAYFFSHLCIFPQLHDILYFAYRKIGWGTLF